VNAFFYWWGAHGSDSNSGLIRLDGDSYAISKRFWALAAFSRFVRPGAVRVAASGGALGVSAFRNPDGSLAVQVLNTGTAAAPVDLSPGRGGVARPYVVDATHDLAPAPPRRLRHGTLRTTVPARALVSFLVR
jgi:glucosylceramidase